MRLKNNSDQQVLASKSLILVFQLFQLVKLVSLDKSLDTLPRIILVNKDQSKFLRSLPKRKLTGFHQANTMDLHWTRFRRALKKFLNKESYSKMKKQSKVRLSSTKRKIRLFSKKNIKVQAFLWLRQYNYMQVVIVLAQKHQFKLLHSRRKIYRTRLVRVLILYQNFQQTQMAFLDLLSSQPRTLLHRRQLTQHKQPRC